MGARRGRGWRSAFWLKGAVVCLRPKSAGRLAPYGGRRVTGMRTAQLHRLAAELGELRERVLETVEERQSSGDAWGQDALNGKLGLFADLRAGAETLCESLNRGGAAQHAPEARRLRLHLGVGLEHGGGGGGRGVVVVGVV